MNKYVEILAYILFNVYKFHYITTVFHIFLIFKSIYK